MSAPRPFVLMKCPCCGWVHAAVPLEVALRNADSPEQLARYYECFRCAMPTSTFVPAKPEDAPQGCRLQPVVLGKPPTGGPSHAS